MRSAYVFNVWIVILYKHQLYKHALGVYDDDE
jgi:hypothetical protein